MKKLLPIILLAVGLTLHACGQGVFDFFNDTAPTHLGTFDGPLAGQGIWAQALGGFTTNSLMPVGVPVEHGAGGLLSYIQEIQVPWAPPRAIIFVQMAAWDGTLWGTSFTAVPANQIGFTDVVSVGLVTPTGNTQSPQFTQPAIVPAVPEPSVLVLAVLGGAILIFRRRSPLR